MNAMETLSFIVIGLMAAAVGLISFARVKTTGWVRKFLSFVAFLLIIPAFFGMVIVVLR
jgi:hypothetical protein